MWLKLKEKKTLEIRNGQRSNKIAWNLVGQYDPTNYKLSTKKNCAILLFTNIFEKMLYSRVFLLFLLLCNFVIQKYI